MDEAELLGDATGDDDAGLNTSLSKEEIAALLNGDDDAATLPSSSATAEKAAAAVEALLNAGTGSTVASDEEDAVESSTQISPEEENALLQEDSSESNEAAEATIDPAAAVPAETGDAPSTSSTTTSADTESAGSSGGHSPSVSSSSISLSVGHIRAIARVEKEVRMKVDKTRMERMNNRIDRVLVLADRQSSNYRMIAMCRTQLQKLTDAFTAFRFNCRIPPSPTQLNQEPQSGFKLPMKGEPSATFTPARNGRLNANNNNVTGRKLTAQQQQQQAATATTAAAAARRNSLPTTSSATATVLSPGRQQRQLMPPPPVPPPRTKSQQQPTAMQSAPAIPTAAAPIPRPGQYQRPLCTITQTATPPSPLQSHRQAMARHQQGQQKAVTPNPLPNGHRPSPAASSSSFMSAAGAAAASSSSSAAGPSSSRSFSHMQQQLNDRKRSGDQMMAVNAGGGGASSSPAQKLQRLHNSQSPSSSPISLKRQPNSQHSSSPIELKHAVNSSSPASGSSSAPAPAGSNRAWLDRLLVQESASHNQIRALLTPAERERDFVFAVPDNIGQSRRITIDHPPFHLTRPYQRPSLAIPPDTQHVNEDKFAPQVSMHTAHADFAVSGKLNGVVRFQAPDDWTGNIARVCLYYWIGTQNMSSWIRSPFATLELKPGADCPRQGTVKFVINMGKVYLNTDAQNRTNLLIRQERVGIVAVACASEGSTTRIRGDEFIFDFEHVVREKETLARQSQIKHLQERLRGPNGAQFALMPSHQNQLAQQHQPNPAPMQARLPSAAGVDVSVII